jgi:orotate phosphoribosyltransferase
LSYDVLFGPAYKVVHRFQWIPWLIQSFEKGIPLVCALSIALDGKQVPSQFAFSRKEKKDHGEGGQIVGTPLKDQRIVVVDDVITAGTAIRESAALIQQQSGLLSGVLIAIDRQEKGLDTPLSAIQQVERDFGIPVVSIVSLSDIILYLEELGDHAEHVARMRDYRSQWGISN